MSNTWQMYAGRDTHNGGYKNFGHPRYVEMYGHTEIVPVTLTEDPDGPYYGWMGSESIVAGKVWSEADTEPQMIQQFEGLFAMQFTYGVEAEVKAGKGRVVRLSVAETDLTAD